MFLRVRATALIEATGPLFHPDSRKSHMKRMTIGAAALLALSAAGAAQAQQSGLTIHESHSIHCRNGEIGWVNFDIEPFMNAIVNQSSGDRLIPFADRGGMTSFQSEDASNGYHIVDLYFTEQNVDGVLRYNVTRYVHEYTTDYGQERRTSGPCSPLN